MKEVGYKKRRYSKQEDDLILSLYNKGYNQSQIHIKLKELGIFRMPNSIQDRIKLIKPIGFVATKITKK